MERFNHNLHKNQIFLSEGKGIEGQLLNPTIYIEKSNQIEQILFNNLTQQINSSDQTLFLIAIESITEVLKINQKFQKIFQQLFTGDIIEKVFS